MKNNENMSTHKFVVASPNVVSRKIGDIALLVNYENNEILELNSSGYFLWQIVQNPCKGKNIIKKFQDKHQLNQREAEEVVGEFIDKLFKKNFILLSKKGHCQKFFPTSPSDIWENLENLATEKNIPVKAEIEVTKKCNLSCKHCYIDDKEKPEIPLNKMLNIIDQLEKAGCLFITFTGGEPFLRNDFLKIVKYARDKRMGVNILTNGTLITPLISKKLSKLNIGGVQVSVYSNKPEIHDSITNVQSSFAKAIKGIKMLKEEGLNVTIATVVMRPNFSTYKKVEKLAEKLGVEWSIGFPVRSSNNNLKKVDNLKMNLDQLEQFVRDNTEEVCQKFAEEPSKKPVCHAGSAICFIDASCNVMPCVMFPYKLDNLYKKSFKNIWDNSSFLKKFHNLTISDFDICSNCKFLQYCRFCPGLNYGENGDIFKPAKSNCRLAKKIKEYYTK